MAPPILPMRCAGSAEENFLGTPHPQCFPGIITPPRTTSFGQSMAPRSPYVFKSRNGKVRLEPPRKDWTKTVTLYGDEAVRETVAFPFVCISLVGGSDRFVKGVCDKVTTLKDQLERERDPTSWRFHMADIHSGQRRKRHKIFKNWNRDKCQQAVNGLFNVIAESNDSLFVFAPIYPIRSGSSMIATKRKAYMATPDAIRSTTSRSLAFRLAILLMQQAVGNNRAVIQHSARSAFLGSERQLMYRDPSHGVPVPEPQFVKQGSHVCLELSDFVAFVVARELYCWQNRRQSEYLSSQLGNVYYSWPDAEGYARERIRGIPRNQIFPSMVQ